MAIARPSALVAGISGNLGGVTFANTRHGLTLKHRPAKNPHPDGANLRQQANFALAQRTWRTLSQARRTAYATTAAQTFRIDRLGQKRPYGGFQYFVTLSLLRLAYGESIALDPPLPTPFEFCDYIIAEFASNSQTVKIGAAPATPTNTFDAFAYGALTWQSTENPPTPPMTLLGGYLFTNNAQTDVTAGWLQHFQIPIIGQRAFVKIRAYNGSSIAKLEIIDIGAGSPL